MSKVARDISRLSVTRILISAMMLIMYGGTTCALASCNGTSAQTPLTGFAVTSLTSGQVIRDQDVPLTITGTYVTEGTEAVWVVLEDGVGRYYLQQPPVQFQANGRWIASNVRPGPGIVNVDFVAVTPDGNAIFVGMVKAHAFSAFQALPDGSMFLVRISITSQVSGG
jgi:hypothetical protein